MAKRHPNHSQSIAPATSIIYRDPLLYRVRFWKVLWRYDIRTQTESKRSPLYTGL